MRERQFKRTVPTGPPVSTPRSAQSRRAESAWSCLVCMRRPRCSFSAWLERDLKETVEQALAIEADSGTALSSYDKIFSHLTGKQIDAACAVAQIECKDFALAVLLAQAGEDTALPEDMRAQVLWLESQYAHERIDDESAKLLQIYRLLAGEVDEVLCHISEDFKSDAGARHRYTTGTCRSGTLRSSLALVCTCARRRD